MRVRVIATSTWPVTAEKLLKDYPCLNDFEFEVENEPYEKFVGWIYDENNKRIAEIEPAIRTVAYTNIESLEEVLKLMDIVKHPLIFNRNYENDELTFEIYDGYRE